MGKIPMERRRFIKSSAFGLFGITSFGFAAAGDVVHQYSNNSSGETLYYRYPAINDEMVGGIVGASHANFAKVKEMLTKRPELATSCWDWGFGDFETALGAASHTGRRDIAELLMSHGARPDIFTFTMMGMLKAVQEAVETVPGIQSHPGPHGITLLQHAKNRLEDKSISSSDSANMYKMIAYLEGLGNADVKPKSLELTEAGKALYSGDYRFGDKEEEVFTVNIHRLGFLQVSRKGLSGRKLTRIGEHQFFPAGSPSVKIIFTVKDERSVSLTIHEPEPLVTAVRV